MAPPENADYHIIQLNYVTAPYFDVMGLDLLQGRNFTSADDTDGSTRRHRQSGRRSALLAGGGSHRASHATAQQSRTGLVRRGRRLGRQDLDRHRTATTVPLLPGRAGGFSGSDELRRAGGPQALRLWPGGWQTRPGG